MAIRLGLEADHRAAAARLYWQAFGGKLGRVLGPDARALAYLERVMRGDHCLAAVDAAGALLGVAGFKSPKGSFVGGGRGDLRAVYGLVGGWWRGMLLSALNRELDNERFLVDGLCVDARHRGQGIGGALLAALAGEARARGYQMIRLDVVAQNPRARALYERHGFRAVRTQKLGPLGLIFGFTAATTMVRVLDPAGG